MERTLDYSEFNGPAAQDLIVQKMGTWVSPSRVVWDSGDEDCEMEGIKSWGTRRNITKVYAKKLGCSVSEGIGYGMLLAVMHDDWDTYNALWSYNILAREAGSGVNGLMPSKLRSFSEYISKAAVLDADLDIATSLILAYQKTKQEIYLADAKILVDKIYSVVNPTSLLIHPGDNWKSRDIYNISYISPVAYRLFATIGAAHDWNAVLAANYAYMSQVQDNGKVPFFPDWSNAAGVPTDPNNGSAKTSYMLFDKESVRIPWRIAWDYYWYQDLTAKKILTAMSGFISEYTGNDPSKIPNTSFNYLTGELSTSLIEGLNYTGVANYNITSYAGYYFMEILMNLFDTLMNGGFVKP